MLIDAVPVAASGYQDRINPMHMLCLVLIRMVQPSSMHASRLTHKWKKGGGWLAAAAGTASRYWLRTSVY